MQINPSSTGQRMTSLYSIRFLQCMLRRLESEVETTFTELTLRSFLNPLNFVLNCMKKRKKQKKIKLS